MRNLQQIRFVNKFIAFSIAIDEKTFVIIVIVNTSLTKIKKFRKIIEFIVLNLNVAIHFKK